MAISDNYYSIAQAAEHSGLTRQTIYRWIKGGNLNVERAGREGLILKKDIADMRCPTCGRLRKKI